MLKSSVLELIRSFSNADISRFHSFIRSPLQVLGFKNDYNKFPNNKI